MTKTWEDIVPKEEILEVYMRCEEKSHSEKKMIFPIASEVSRALDLVPFESVKVCIIGQDPYHGVGQANGLAFSVSKGHTIPPSLRNIYKELNDDLGVAVPSHGDLTDWAKQGVLLLNTTLTVQHGQPLSHANLGWERITGKIINRLSKREDPVIFILWGKKAEEIFLIRAGSFKEKYVLKAAHPSPFSVKKFFGCKHFSKVNKILSDLGKPVIDWSIHDH